ncbi:MAG: DUF427 domain-containing protein [Actinomycetota bacterium]
MRAEFNGTVIAESDATVVVEGTHYFPRSSVKMQYFEPSDLNTFCSWKGDASYFHLTVDGTTKRNVAWYYPEPMEKATHIKGYVAFYPDVTVA